MKKSKAIIWFVLWGISIAIGTVFSAACNISALLKNGNSLITIPYADYQIFLLLIFLPFILLPMLCMSYYYAIKEKKKKIMIASLCLAFHHVFCVIAVLLQVLGG